MKNLICFLIVAFFATTTFAQRKGMTIKVDAAVERMTNELDLSPEQQVQIKAIYENKIADKKSRNAQTKEEYAAARENFDQQINEVLTPGQIEKRASLKADYKEKMKALRDESKSENAVHPRGERVGKGKRLGKKGPKSARLGRMSPEMIENRAVKSTERLDKQVDLTESQEAEINTAYLNFFQKNQAIATDTSLDAAAKKELLSQLKADHKTEITSILTTEQQAARKANRKVKKAKRQELQQQ